MDEADERSGVIERETPTYSEAVMNRLPTHWTVDLTSGGPAVEYDVIEQTRKSIAAWIGKKGLSTGDWLFPSRSKQGAHLSTASMRD
jgi:hypothetical protein